MANSLNLHEVVQQVTAITYGVWRKRWYMLATAWLISIIGWGVVSMMPYKYSSAAKVYVDTETALGSIARSLNIDLDVMRHADVVYQTLITRPNLEKIIRRSDYLDRFAKNDQQMNDMVNQLQNNISIAEGEQGIYNISYENDDARLSDSQRAEVARAVVSNLLTFVNEASLQDSSGDSGSALEFLNRQIKEYADRLEAAERKHAVFRQENIEYLGGQDSFLGRFEIAKNDHRQTLSKISELQVTVATLKTQLEGIPPTIRSASRQERERREKDPIEERIGDLEKKYDDLKATGAKDMHPDIINVRSQISSLQTQLAAKRKQQEQDLLDAAAAGKQSTSGIESPNALYEKVMLDLIQTSTEVKTLERRAEEQAALVLDMEEKAKKVPEIDAQEQRLKRDYRTIRSQYNELLQEKQDQQIRIDVADQINSDSAFRVIEHPETPVRPSGPPRQLFLTATLIGGLIGGLGVSFIISQLRPVVVTVEQLSNNFDLKILGNVSQVVSDEENRQMNMELLLFGLVSALLFITYIGLVALDIFGALIIGN